VLMSRCQRIRFRSGRVPGREYVNAMSTRITQSSNLESVRKPLYAMGAYLKQSGLEVDLLDLMSMRASQINGCAFCLAMHARDLRERGEREDRLAVLSAWRETSWFTDRERAALAWTEAVTTLEHNEVPDDIFTQARAEFSERELVDLTLSVIAINSWNRLNIAFQNPPQPFTIEAREAVTAD